MEASEFLLSRLGGTQREIVRRLRSEDRTVRELANHLDLTRNAVRAQLSKLKSEGIVEVAGRRPTRRKPEHVYGLTRKAELLFPKSYETLFNTVLSVLTDAEWVNAEPILAEVARRLAQSHKPVELESDTEGRVDRARRVLEELGGLPDVVETDGTYRLEGSSCPFAASVRAHGKTACDLARTLIEELTERPVERRCDADGECPQCKFVIQGG
ncbi:MAG: helix-turn-helix transcriptional regulator [Salinibacter sp.]